MTGRDEAIHKHLTDMMAVEQHVLDAVARQREDESVRANADVNELVIRMERVMSHHVDALKRLGETYGVEQAKWKSAVTAAVGVAEGLFARMREQPISRAVRDNYVALSLVAMSYTALHAFGLSVKEVPVAELAQKHLLEVTPLVVALSKVLPEIVARETAVDIAGADATVGPIARENTQRAWDPQVAAAAE